MSSPFPLTTTQYVIDTGPSHAPLKAAVKKYTAAASTRYPGDKGYILVFVHGTGFMKELWEPIISRLLARESKMKHHSKVLECWALDCQTHGASAPLNDEILVKCPGVFDVYVYRDAIVKLYESNLLGISDYTKQKVVLVGHSAGTVAVVLASKSFKPILSHPFSMMVLVEPVLLSDETMEKMTPMFRQVAKTTPKRRAVWDRKEDARRFIENSFPYKIWDQKSRELYIENALRPLPTPFQNKEKGFTLACKPIDEAAGFENQHYSIDALNTVNTISVSTPIHFIFGARNDMFSREVQDVMHDSGAGRKAASVVRIKGAGHLVVQEKPDALADVIFDILCETPSKL